MLLVLDDYLILALYLSLSLSLSLEILLSVSLTLYFISKFRDFDATNCSTAAGLISKQVCIEKMKIIYAYLDYTGDDICHTN